MPTDTQVPQPAKPPEIDQRVNLSRGQSIGLPIMLLFPVLALFGVFGVSQDSVTREGEALEVTIRYSGRTQFMARHDLEIEVTNRGEDPLEGVTVLLNRELVDSFAEASFIPSPTGTTGAGYLFELGSVPGSASKIVSGRIAAGMYWSRPGTATVSSSNGESVEVEFQTFVYP